MDTEQFLCGFLFLTGGLLLVACGASLLSFRPTRNSRRVAVRGEGIVTGHVSESLGETLVRFHPLVTFRDSSGREHCVRVNGTTVKEFKDNQPVKIAYGAEDPPVVEIVGFNPRGKVWSGAVTMMALGGLCALVGALIWIVRIPFISDFTLSD